MTTIAEERAAWHNLVRALDDERELLRARCYDTKRPSTSRMLKATQAVDKARLALRNLNINPFTGLRMNSHGRDVTPRRKRNQ